jgi:hypothetical protein
MLMPAKQQSKNQRGERASLGSSLRNILTTNCLTHSATHQPAIIKRGTTMRWWKCCVS